MRHFYLIYLTAALVLLWGCRSVENRMIDIEANRASKRVEAIQAVWEKVHAEEMAISAMGLPLSEEGRSLLEKLAGLAANDPDPQVRATALFILGQSEHWRDRSLFMSALADKAWRCQFEGISALQRKKDPRAIPGLIRLLAQSTHVLIRVESIRLLKALEAKEAIPALYHIVVNLLERNQAQMAARTALAQLSGQTFSSEDHLSWKAWYTQTYLPAMKAAGGSGSPDQTPPEKGS